MKTRIARVTALSLALIGLAAGPAAASSLSLELPTAPGTISGPSVGGGASTDIAFCDAVGWWPWCRK